jgi:hypothetical protein
MSICELELDLPLASSIGIVWDPRLGLGAELCVSRKSHASWPHNKGDVTCARCHPLTPEHCETGQKFLPRPADYIAQQINNRVRISGVINFVCFVDLNTGSDRSRDSRHMASTVVWPLGPLWRSIIQELVRKTL